MYTRDRTNKLRYEARALFIKNAVIIFAAIFALSTVCLIKTALDIKKRASFPKGITVNDIDLYGMTYDNAKKAVSDSIQKRLDSLNLAIHAGGEDFSIRASRFLEADIDETLDAAYSAGRELEEFDHGEGRFYTTYYISTDKLKEHILSIADKTDIVPIEPCAEFDEKNRTFTYAEGIDGRSLDVDQALKTVVEHIEKSDYSDIELSYNITKPVHTVEDIKANTKSICEFKSYTTNNYNRNKNIELMCSYVNGYVLEPDEILSINELVGERTVEKGFLPAPAIMDGKYTVDDIGGGICQLSGTLYNMALRANMEIVERSPHSWPSDYLDIGLDSTLDWNTQKDLKIKNITGYNMYIAAWLERADLSGANVLHVQVFGQPFPDGVTVKVWSEITEVTQPEPAAITYTSSLAPGSSRVITRARTGYKTRTWREFYYNGALLDSEIVATSSYSAIRGEIMVGKGEKPKPTSTPVPTPDPTENPGDPIIDPPTPTEPPVNDYGGR